MNMNDGRRTNADSGRGRRFIALDFCGVALPLCTLYGVRPVRSATRLLLRVVALRRCVAQPRGCQVAQDLCGGGWLAAKEAAAAWTAAWLAAAATWLCEAAVDQGPTSRLSLLELLACLQRLPKLNISLGCESARCGQDRDKEAGVGQGQVVSRQGWQWQGAVNLMWLPALRASACGLAGG